MRKIVGEVFLRDFALDHAYAQSIHKVLSIAVYPARLIPVHPLPKGFLPKLGPQKAKGYLRPDEDAALLSCTKVAPDGSPVMPLWRRVFWAFLSREGTREGEAIELRVGDLDLKHGGVTLDENKSDDARARALDPSVTAALRSWLACHPLCEDGKTSPPKDARVFVDDEGKPLDAAHLPRTLRADLIAAGVNRPELHATTKARLRLRVHDLRGTFVTVALANGATEIVDLRSHRPQVERDDQPVQARGPHRVRAWPWAPEAACWRRSRSSPPRSPSPPRKAIPSRPRARRTFLGRSRLQSRSANPLTNPP